MLGGWNGQLTKQNSPAKTGEKWRELRHGKREPVVTIPPVVRPVVVRVEPATIIVTVRVQQVRIAVGLREISSIPPPLEYSQGWIESGIEMP
jgi:hypothetical protein